ncbi:MAG TPA: ATP-binding cassette domain-containing protein [Myxococcales bacterium]|nr:ATP-binding cassette domain-containing protein [Myxococcales bacterium]
MTAAPASFSQLVPEVVQTSALDCGPACLKSLLGGLGIEVSYPRLREACQTDVDGTSIDTMEELALQLGVEAEQVMLPLDHVFAQEPSSLPAVAVMRLPGGATHFVLLWRRYGPFLQLMDPATGRRFTTCNKLERELHLHAQSIPAASFREWAATDEFTQVLLGQLRELDAGRTPQAYLEEALADPGWEKIAALDAGTRAVRAMIAGGALQRGPSTGQVLDRLLARGGDAIPAGYWSVRPDPASPSGEPALRFTGAVLLRVQGRRATNGAAEGPLPADVAATLAASRVRPVAALLAALREDGLRVAALLCAGLLMLAAGSIAEVVLLRGLFDLGRELRLLGQRAAGLAGLAVLTVSLVLVELPVAAGVLRLGRRLELRLRWSLMLKLPLIDDRYFQSRLTSDMAFRSHAIHTVRALPRLASQFLLVALELLATTAALIWLSPASWALAVGSCLVTLSLALLLPALLAEGDLRLQIHNGSLSRSYLDAMLGLSAVRVYRGERVLRREHEAQLVEWARSGLSLQKTVIAVEGVLLVVSSLLVAALVHRYVSAPGRAAGSVLLVVFWALRQQWLGLRLSAITRVWPSIRNRVARLLEPLGAAQESTAPAAEPGPAAASGCRVEMRGVEVRAGGHLILEQVTLAVEPGCHVAVVGSSGAGKSSLLGLLLGWHQPAAGELLVDGLPLTPARLADLRQRTAWVDPAVQLWNRSCLDNLRYGIAPEHPLSLGEVFAAADLQSVLEALPDGLQTPLGEGGGLVSGGQGQRVRLGRALLRPDVRLALLDEPFRGLDRDKRRRLLDEARRIWRGATLFCVSHDVGMTRNFDKVLVVEQGRIAEFGSPEILAADGGSRYARFLAAEEEVRRGLWKGGGWRRLWMEDGGLIERPAVEHDEVAELQQSARRARDRQG